MVEPLLALTVVADDDRGLRRSGTSSPRRCEVSVDCRLLPGQTAEEAEPDGARSGSDDGEYELEWRRADGRHPL